MNCIIVSTAARAVRSYSRFKVPTFRNQMVTTQFSTEKEKLEKTDPKDVQRTEKVTQPLREEATKSEDFVDDSEIQPEWLSLEKRLAFRKPKRKGFPTLRENYLSPCCANLLATLVFR